MKIFKYIRVMYKYWCKSPKHVTSHKVIACKDCKYFKSEDRGNYCLRPTGRFIETFDPINGIITTSPEILNHTCSYQRAYEVDDVTKNMMCGKEGRFFKAKRLTK